MPIDWTSPELLKKRVAIFSEDLLYRVYNRSVKYYARTLEVKKVLKGFKWRTMKDNVVCIICQRRDDKTYYPGQFMPLLPAHFGCRCGWSVIAL